MRPRSTLAALVAVAAFSSTPALATSTQGSGTDSNGDGLDTPSLDIVSTGFRYADSGALELTVTTAAPIDPQATPFSITWNVSDGPKSGDCGPFGGQDVTISYRSDGSGYAMAGGGPQPQQLQRGTGHVSGSTVVYDIADPALAGHDFACTTATLNAIHGQIGVNERTDLADRAPAAAPGFDFPGPNVSFFEAGKSLLVSDSGTVRLLMHSFTFDTAKGDLTLRTAHRVRLTRSSPLRVATLGSVDDIKLDGMGNGDRATVRLTRQAMRFLRRYDRVSAVASIESRDAQGRKSTHEAHITLESPGV